MIRQLKQLWVSSFNWIVSFVPPSDFNDVLILRLDQLGDFVLWLDSAKEYRKLYHNKRLTLLVNGNWYDLAKSLPYWDEVIPLDTIKFRLNPWYRLNFLLFIRKQGFEICICPRHSVKFTLEPPIVAISGAQQKIVCEGSFPIEKQNYFTRSIPMYPGIHELSRNAEFLRGLGRKDFKSTAPKIFTMAEKKDYIVFCPTSFRKHKEWSLENFMILMDCIWEEFGYKIKVCSDKKIKARWFDYVEDLSGKTSVVEFINVIASAKMVVGNDSACIHLASAFDVPSVCIGVESPGRFFPYVCEKPREGMVLPRVIEKKVKDISIEEVWDIVKEMI